MNCCLLPGPHYRNRYLLNFHYQKYFLPGSRPECFQRHHSHLLYPDFPHCQIRCFLCWNFLHQNHLREIYPHYHFSCIRSFRLFTSSVSESTCEFFSIISVSILFGSFVCVSASEGSIPGSVFIPELLLLPLLWLPLFSFFSNAVM